MNPIKSLLNKHNGRMEIPKINELGEMYKTLFNFNLDAAFLLSLEGNFVEVNRTPESLLGLKDNEMVNRSLLSFIDESSFEDMTFFKKEVLKGQQKSITCAMKNVKGETLNIDMTAAPYYLKETILKEKIQFQF